MMPMTLLFVLCASALATSDKRDNNNEDLAVNRFREYIKLDTSKDENIGE